MTVSDDERMTLTWDAVPSPIGLVTAVFDGAALVSCHAIDHDPEWEIERVSRQLGESPIHTPGAAADLATQLDEYFDGTRRSFDLDLDWRLVDGFAREALRAVATIAYGQRASYGEVAMWAGRPRAARAVGTACRITPFSIVVPAHRVVRADGSIGEYGADPSAKRFLLDLEQHSLQQAL